MKQIFIFIFVLIGIIILFLLQIFDPFNSNDDLYSGALSLLILVLAIECLSYFIYFIQEKKNISEERKYIATGIVHDLKSPLGGIYSMLNFFLFTEKDSVRTKMLQNAKVRIKRLSCTVESLLLLNKEDSNLIICRSETDISQIIEDVVEDAKVYFKDKIINITIDDQLNHIKLYVDALCVTNAFVNLIDNALKYSDEAVDVHVSLYKLLNAICISVKDNGWGISKDMQPNIFTPFFRGIKGTCSHGHGIGLSYSKKIIEMHGGKIDFESIEGVGSTFYIILPLDV